MTSVVTQTNTKKQKVYKKAKNAKPKDYQGTGGSKRDFGSPNQYVIPKEIKLDVSKPVKNKVKANTAKAAGAATAGATAAYAYETYVGRNSQN